MRFELYVTIRFEAPLGMMSEAGVDAIQKFWREQRLGEGEWKSLNPTNEYVFLPVLPKTWDWQWVVTKGVYRGTFPKRAGQFLHKQGLKVPESFLARLGNLARAHSESRLIYTFDFVNQFDWQAGEFADESSCYWGERSGARVMLQNNGGLAVRFYGDCSQGIARAWLAPIADDATVYVVFNAYGLDLITVARVLAGYFGVTYKPVSVSNNGQSHGQLWINGAVGFVIGAADELEAVDDVCLEWDEEYAYSCYECGDMLHEDDAYRGADDEHYCEHCFYDRFGTCEDCGEAHYHDNLTYVDGHGDVCEDCLERSYDYCEGCEEYYPTREIVTKGERTLCERCAARED